MRDKTILINALRAAATKAENEPSCYRWASMTQCNCGLVAQEILGGESNVRQVDYELEGGPGWTGVGKAMSVCLSSGIPLYEMSQRLINAGFDAADFKHLEDLSKEQIRERAGLGPLVDYDQREDREAFIRYARAWADILEEKALVDQAMGS
jgi:hypothetical protein